MMRSRGAADRKGERRGQRRQFRKFERDDAGGAASDECKLVPEPNAVRNQATYSPSRNMMRLHVCDA